MRTFLGVALLAVLAVVPFLPASAQNGPDGPNFPMECCYDASFRCVCMPYPNYWCGYNGHMFCTGGGAKFELADPITAWAQKIHETSTKNQVARPDKTNPQDIRPTRSIDPARVQ